MNQLTWIAVVVVVSFCRSKMTMANVQDVSSNSTEFTSTPTLFRSAFIGRPLLASRQAEVPVKEELITATPILFRSAFIGRPPLASRQEEVPVGDELMGQSPVIDNEVIEENLKRTKESGENDWINSNEIRYKKNVRDESDSDESDSDESDSDESDSDESDSDKNDIQVNVESSIKPSRWRPTRFGSSFRLRAVRPPINNRRPN